MGSVSPDSSADLANVLEASREKFFGEVLKGQRPEEPVDGVGADGGLPERTAGRVRPAVVHPTAGSEDHQEEFKRDLTAVLGNAPPAYLLMAKIHEQYQRTISSNRPRTRGQA